MQEENSQIVVKPLKRFIARDIFLNYHYLHYFPKGQPLRTYQFVRNGEMIGVFAVKSPHGRINIEERGKILKPVELMRFWLKENEPNLATQCMGKLLRFLESIGYEYVVSYACECSHQGIIYKASNFVYEGETDGNSDVRIGTLNNKGQDLHASHSKYKFTYKLRIRSGISKIARRGQSTLGT